MKVESAPDPDRYRGALATTALAVTGAALFGAGINEVLGADKALQFYAGYVVEMSLSVDNLFVFLLLFKFFKVRKTVSLCHLHQRHADLAPSRPVDWCHLFLSITKYRSFLDR